MATQVYFIRHGESKYNEWRRNSFFNCTCLCVCDPMIYDPALSKKGQKQVEALRRNVQSQQDMSSKIQLVVTSPLSRAIDTCLGSFFPQDTGNIVATAETPVRSYGPRPLVCALPRERLHKSGDVGISMSALQEKYPDQLDLSDLATHLHPEQWWYDETDLPQGGARAIRPETLLKTQKRVEMFADWLRNRPETCIAVVCHSNFIKTFTRMSRKLNNCEIKCWQIDGGGERVQAVNQ
jgi:broad specificity phosphatase PhoE